MFLSIATAHQPATDLGFLLHKHPERLHEIELTFGKAWLFYPEASQTRCEAVLVLDVDPIGLVRGKGQGEGLLDQYVNDRPYAASSFLSVALNKAFRTAMTGVCNARQELAGSVSSGGRGHTFTDAWWREAASPAFRTAGLERRCPAGGGSYARDGQQTLCASEVDGFRSNKRAFEPPRLWARS
jgi:hypothetical protein